MNVEQLASVAVDCGLQVHRRLGPGLLESAYEKVLAHMLVERGLSVAAQVPIAITIEGILVDPGFRADLLVNDKLLIEVKSVERLQEVHGKQVLTYLRFLELPLGLLMNFSGEKFSHGLKRIVNYHRDTLGSALDIHQ